ncbi:MAG: hypothetical protein PUE67_04985 [Oscillospiraceae bacterium]|nr:hypothetical protein [Oscillospiraceae bacterium]
MATERKKFTFENLVSIYFRKFYKIIFTNLLFAVPTVAVGVILYFLTKPLGQIPSLAISMLTVVICYPLYAGVTLVTRNLGRGEDVKVTESFFGGIADNYKKFLVHSIILYFILTIGIFSFTFYSRMAVALGGIMYVLLITMILIALWLMFTFYYVPLMTVTFDLSLKNIYKNSALMALGELKVNFVTLFSVLIFTAICATPLIFSAGNEVAVIVITAVMLIAVYPASYSLVTGFFIQDTMMMMVTGRGDEVHDIKSTEEKLAKLRNETKDDLENIDIEKVKNSREEYIFHNGKMIKRTTILEMLKDKEEEKENNNE